MPYIGNITQDFNVSNAMLDTDSVTSIKIVDGTIEGADIAANLDLSDSQKIRFGAGNDLQIYHDGSNSRIENSTGSLVLNSRVLIKTADNSESIATFNENGAVELYYDNNKKLETTNLGVTITGTTNSKLSAANGTLVLESTNNDVLVEASDDFIVKVQSSELAINAIGNGAVELYYDNSKKLETTSSGVTVTGGVAVTANISVGSDTGKLYLGASNDLEIYHDGTHSYFVNNTGNLRIQNNGTVKTAQFEIDQIDFNDSANTEVRVRINGDGLSLVQDNDKIQLGASQDLQIYHDGTSNYIASNNGNIILTKASGTEKLIRAIPDGAVELYYDNSKKFETTNTGITLNGTAHLVNSGNFYPNSDGAIQLGLSNRKWSTINGVSLNINGGDAEFRGTTPGTTDMTWDQSENALNFDDNVYARFGTGDDLQIYHDGSNSYIRENGTGSLYIDSNGNGVILRGIQGEDSIVCNANGDVELYYDNSKKFETKSYGAIWIGQLAGLDDSKITFGNGDDLQIYHNGTHSIISNSTGSLFSLADSVIFKNNANNETLMTLAADGAVELYYNNSKKFETTSTGITVSGTEHKFTSGTSGDCVLILEADTDNNDENDIPIIKFRQDGGLDLSAIGTGQTGTASDNHLTLANSAANGGISFRTGTANGYTNAVERMRILAGGGLTFNGDTSTNNALSDYEQGTWTPTAFYGSGSFSAVNNAVCRYVKVGTLVHVSGRFSLTGGGSGELKIEGLPFAKGNPSNDGNSAGIQIYVEGAASNITNDICGLVLDATTVIFIRRSGTTSSGSDVAGLVDGGTTLLIGGTYTTFG